MWTKGNIKLKHSKGFALATHMQQGDNKLKLANWIIEILEQYKIQVQYKYTHIDRYV